jgi:hypothetical protein
MYNPAVGSQFQTRSVYEISHLRTQAMKNLFFMVIYIGLPCAAGIFSIILLADLMDYLKSSDYPLWKKLTFKPIPNIPDELLFVPPIRPIRFVSFLFSAEDLGEPGVKTAKARLKISLAVLLGLATMAVVF